MKSEDIGTKMVGKILRSMEQKYALVQITYDNGGIMNQCRNS